MLWREWLILSAELKSGKRRSQPVTIVWHRFWEGTAERQDFQLAVVETRKAPLFEVPLVAVTVQVISQHEVMMAAIEIETGARHQSTTFLHKEPPLPSKTEAAAVTKPLPALAAAAGSGKRSTAQDAGLHREVIVRAEARIFSWPSIARPGRKMQSSSWHASRQGSC